MTSPMHSFLFSPPPSPPLAVGETQEPKIAALRNLLPPAVRNSFDSLSRSPKSPKLSQGAFLLPPSPQPSRSSSPTGNSRAGLMAGLRGLTPIDVEAANLPTFRPRRLSPILSPRLLRSNVPRPIIRLIVFVAFVLSGCMLLQAVNDAFFPSLHRAQLAVMDGGYVPPQAAASLHHKFKAVAAPPRTQRLSKHPLPASHELLALQTFITESRYNSLRSDIDVSKPVDAEDLIGNAARRLGDTGSAREQQWLAEVAEDHANNVVLWYSSASVPHYAVEGITARHGHGNRATLISTNDRSDAHILRGIFARLGLDLDASPVLVIGGQPIQATEEALEELRSSGQLSEMLSNIGWRV